MESLSGEYIGELKGNPLKRFFRLLSLERKDVGLVYAYAIMNGLINLSLPLGIQAIMSLIMAGQASSSWVILIVIVIVGIIFSSAMQIMQLSIIERMQQRIFTRASFEFAFRIPRMKLEAMIKQYAPELMNRFFDVMTIQKGLSKMLVDFSAAALQIIFSLILLAFYHPFFVFYGITVLALIIFFFYISSPKGLKTSLEESKAKYNVAHWLEELARSMNIFKLAGYTEMPLKETDKQVAKYVKARKKHYKVLVTQYVYMGAFKVLITAGILIIGSALVFGKEINIGQFVASEVIIIIILNSVEKLITTIETIYDVLTGLEKLGAIIDHPIEDESGASFEDIDTGKGISISFKDVSYTYPETSHMALNGITLDIASGEKVCVAGYSASGASTIINLSASLLHLYEGTIKFNGMTMRNLNLISLRSYVGENMSNNEIMNGTIAENISMGRDDITFKDVVQAANSVGLKEFVNGLKDGFDTKIIQNDLTIPDSIAVKINIARSIAENPQLFVMDEPLQNLEKVDKVKIAEFLTKDKQWTLLVASNDAVMASMCDRIIILKDGQIIDQGSFDVISKKPYFFEIFEH